jgi:hypothetical protein
VRRIRARFRLVHSRLTTWIGMNTAISEKARMVNVQRIYWIAPIMTLTLFGVGAFHALTLEAASPVLADWRRQTMVVNALGGIGS